MILTIPLRNLTEIKAKIEYSEGSNYASKQLALLKRDRHNCCHVLPLKEAKQVMDHVWDNLFQYI